MVSRNAACGHDAFAKTFDGDSPAGPLITDGTNLTSGWSFTVDDTSPDTGAHLFSDNGLSLCHTESKTIGDGSGASIVFGPRGYALHVTPSGPVLRFRPDKGNIMSYFLCKRPMTYSASQAATMRATLVNDPQRDYLLCDDPRDRPFRQYIDCKTGARYTITIFPHGARYRLPASAHVNTDF